MQALRSGAGCSSASSGRRGGRAVRREGAGLPRAGDRADRGQRSHRALVAAAARRTSASTRSPAASRTRSRPQYRLHGEGARRASRSRSRTHELTAMPPTMLTKDFQCVTGWRVPDVHWTGVKLSRPARPRRRAAGRRRRCASRRSTACTPRASRSTQARRPDVMVAYELDGKPLRSDHGGPARLYVAPMYGYKSCKWLETASRSSTTSIPGYWENNGYDVDGWVGRSNGRDDAAHMTSARTQPAQRAPAVRSASSASCTGATRRCSSSCWSPGVAVLRAAVDGRRAPPRGEDDPRVRGPAAADPVAARDRAAGRPPAPRAISARLNRWTPTTGAGGRAARGRRAARQVQSRPEAERDLRRRVDRRDADDRIDHALVRAVPRQLAHGATFVHDWVFIGCSS